MAWNLEIHHIDVGHGESTLVVVRNNGEICKTVLIDGGGRDYAAKMISYISDLGIKALDIIIASHYDNEHVGGLISILGSRVLCNEDTKLYDRGAPYNYCTNQYTRKDENTPYTQAILASGCCWATQNVYGDTYNTGMPSALEIPGNRPCHGPEWMSPYWLVEQGDILKLGDGAPTMKCVAANGYITGYFSRILSGNDIDLENELSLAFLIKFNNFKYYTGGDIESTQEVCIANSIGHVSAIKVSHHGSNRSTDQTFLKITTPKTAVISCGNNNYNDHPGTRVIDNLENSRNILQYYITSCGGPIPRTDITGSSFTNVSQLNVGRKSRVAGDYRNPGNIVITVNEAQSTWVPEKFDVQYWEGDLVPPRICSALY